MAATMQDNNLVDLLCSIAEIEVTIKDPACTNFSSDLFFAQSHSELNKAKKVCHACGARQECLQLALRNEEHSGVWGGVLFKRGEPDVDDLLFVEELGDTVIPVAESVSSSKKKRLSDNELTEEKTLFNGFVPDLNQQKKVFIFDQSFSADSLSGGDVQQNAGAEEKNGVQRPKRSYPMAPEYKVKKRKPRNVT